MNALEFSQRLIRLLNDVDLQEVLKKAASKGCSVPGFKNLWKAPRAAIIKNMECKEKSGKYYYEIVLQEIANLDSSQNVICTMARQWMQKDNDDIVYKRIEEDLRKAEGYSSLNSKKNTKKYVPENTIQKEKYLKENEELQKRNEELQTKNKKLQLTIQSNKIEIDNLKKSLLQLEKMCEKLKKDFDSKQNDYAENIRINDEKEKYINNILKQLDELKKYKEVAPKILCFFRSETEKLDWSGYNVTLAKEWNEEQKIKLNNQIYDEIWIVHKGFSYNDVIEIKNSASCVVKEFLSIERLKSKIGGEK